MRVIHGADDGKAAQEGHMMDGVGAANRIVHAHAIGQGSDGRLVIRFLNTQQIGLDLAHHGGDRLHASRATKKDVIGHEAEGHVRGCTGTLTT